MFATLFAFIGMPCILSAQDTKEDKVEKNEKSEKKETQEIIIRNKKGKDLNLKVEINGDNITVNGKPLSEFKDDGVTINKRKMTITGHNRIYDFGNDATDFNMDFNMDKDFMKEWNGKEVSKPFLGVTTEKADDGARVTNVVKGSAAEKAGLKEGDIISKVGDKKVADGESLSELVTSSKPKETVKITYKRGGNENTVKATLGERKMSGAMTYAFRSPRVKMKTFSMPRTPNINLYNEDGLADLETFAPNAGYNFSTFPRQKKLGLKIQDTDEGGNVKVIDVEEGSAAEKAGLKKDDIITEISGKKIANTDEAREQLNPAEAKSSYSVKALRNGTEMTFDVKIPKKLKTADL